MYDYNYNYNYVIFNPDSSLGVYKSMFSELENEKDVKLIYSFFGSKHKIQNILFKIHFSKRLNSYFQLPFKKLWNRYLFNDTFNNAKPIVFVCLSDSWILKDADFFLNLRKKYPKCKLVWAFTDTVNQAYRSLKNFDLDYIKKNFDLVLSYNLFDCRQYNLNYFVTPVCQQDLSPLLDAEKTDITFVGKAKDRFPILLEICKNLTASGLNCDFWILGVPNENRVDCKGMNYIDHSIPYEVVQKKMINSKCILEILQGGVCAFTNTGIQGVAYNKKILTTSNSYKYTKYYNEKYIQTFTSPNDIDISFLKSEIKPDFKYSGEFSARRFLSYIDSLLMKKTTDVEFWKNIIDIEGMISDY